MTKVTTITVQPPVKLDKLADGKHPVEGAKGLTLRVRGASRVWTFRYTSPLTGKEAYLSLGPLSSVNGLAVAMKARDEAAQVVRDGRCPQQAQDETRAAAKLAQIKLSERKTYRQYVEGLKLKGLPRSQQAAIRYGVDILGDVADLRPDEITFTHLVDKLTPIWGNRGKAVASVKYISQFLRLAQEDGHIDQNASNPCRMARLDRHIKVDMPAEKHRKAVPFEAIPDLLTKLRQGRNDCGDALTFLIVEMIILTALRSNEVTRLLWSYIDMDRKLIAIPRDCMKGDMVGADPEVTHFEVPLTPSMIRVLERAKFLAPPKNDNCPVFPSKASKKDRFFDDGTVLDVLETMGFRQADAPAGEKETIHGFRSTFVGWAHKNRSQKAKDGTVSMRWEKADVQACLAHVEKDKTERAYDRTLPVETRWPIMLAWNAAVEPKVVELDQRRPAPRRAGGGVY